MSVRLRRLLRTRRKSLMAGALILGVVFATASILLRPAGAALATPPPATTAAAPSVVDLSPEQASAIQFGAVESYAFPVEKEAVGSISFDEDPLIVQAESALLSAAAADNLASKELARARSLYEGGDGTAGVSQRELEQATSDAETAHAQLVAARYALHALGESDTDMEALLAGKVHHDTARHEWAVAYVAEDDSPALRVGQPATVSVIAYPDKTFAATVSKIYATVDPNTHRMAVRCEIADAQHLLRTGMLADVTIQVQKAEESPAVPTNAVVREGDGTMTAWVTTDRRHFTQRIVVTGLREDGRVQILSGLRPGEQVVTDGAIFLDNMLQAPSGDD